MVEAGGGPDGARFEPPVLELERLAEVRVGAVKEEAFEVGEHGGVVGLDAEHEVGAGWNRCEFTQWREGATGNQWATVRARPHGH